MQRRDRDQMIGVHRLCAGTGHGETGRSSAAASHASVSAILKCTAMAALLLASGSALAGGDGLVRSIAATLDLSDAQHAELAAAIREMRGSYGQVAAKAPADGDRQCLNEPGHGYFGELRQAIARILSAEQLARLRAEWEHDATRWFAAGLDLHPSQFEPVRVILSELFRDEFIWDWFARRHEVREALAGVLTSEQLERFDARFDGSGREARLDRLVASLTESLELHASQVAPVREIIGAELEARSRALWLTLRQARETGFDTAQWRERNRMEQARIRETTRQRLSTVLTPAQFERLDRILPGR